MTELHGVRRFTLRPKDPRQMGMFLVAIALGALISYLLTARLVESQHVGNAAQKAGVANGQQAVAGQNLATQVTAACVKGGAVARQLGPLCSKASVVATTKPSPVPGPNGTVIPGLQGSPGVAGPAGANGANGANGVNGVQGVAGQPGAAGAAGASGASGAPGTPGSPGPAGPQGIAGPTGPAGSPGPAGPTGPQGPPGANGTNGSDGASGASGAPGEAPQTFTFTFLGVTYTCTQDAADDTSAPSYTCVTGQ